MRPVRASVHRQIDPRRGQSGGATQRPARVVDKDFNRSGNGARPAVVSGPGRQYIIPCRHVAPGDFERAAGRLADFVGAREKFDQREVAIGVSGVRRDSDVRSGGDVGVVARTCDSDRGWIVCPGRAERGGLQGDVAIRMRGHIT